jgi:hypothetical protein
MKFSLAITIMLYFLSFRVFTMLNKLSDVIDRQNLSTDLQQLLKNSTKSEIIENNANFQPNAEIKKIFAPVAIITQNESVNKKNTLNKNIAIINKIETNINFDKDFADGFVKEKVTFVLKNGIYNTFTYIISLGGTTLRHYDIKLSTQEVKLQTAKVVRNCYDSSALYQHPYICIIATFDDIDLTDKTLLVPITYEYIAEGLLRQRVKPFQDSKENVLIWIYHNHDTYKDLENISLLIQFKEALKSVKVYPEKYAYNATDGVTNIRWDNIRIKPNDYQNFALNVPLFNSHCKEMVRGIIYL